MGILISSTPWRIPYVCQKYGNIDHQQKTQMLASIYHTYGSIMGTVGVVHLHLSICAPCGRVCPATGGNTWICTDWTSNDIYKSPTIYNWLVVQPPLWKIWKSIGMIIPNRWENKKCSKPPTRYIILRLLNLCWTRPFDFFLHPKWTLFIQSKATRKPQRIFRNTVIMVSPTGRLPRQVNW